MVELSVLIVTYDSAAEIDACLDAVLAQDIEGELEVIVVDNASVDDTVERVETRGGKVELIRNSTNEGYAAGVNAAFAASTGRFVALLNPDCVPDPGCLAALVDHLKHTPGVGVAAAVLRNEDGSVQDFARAEQSVAGVLLTFTDIGQRIDRRWRASRAMDERRYARVFASPITEPVAVDCPAAACVVIWRQLMQPRPMDPRFPLLFNDGDLYRRIRGKGYRADIVPGAGAMHLYGASLRRVPRARMRAEMVAGLRHYTTNWSPLRRWAVWLGLAADGAIGVVETAVKPGGADTAARGQARGTLGGLGLPGGVKPWLTPPVTPKSGLRATVRRGRQAPRRTARSLTRRLRRNWFVLRLRLAGLWVGSRVDVDVHPGADIAWSQVLEIRPRRHVVVRVGNGASIRRGVTLRLGGTLEIGAYSDIRWNITLNVNGHLKFSGRNVLGRGTAVHADGTMIWDWGAGTGEYCTIVDSDHVVDGSLVHVLDQPAPQADVKLGGAVFLGSHVIVTAGCTVGAGSVVGGNSVVSRDIPEGVIAVGAPAKPLKDLPHRGG